MVYKMSQSLVTALLTFKKGNSPAVGMVIGITTTLGKAPEAEGHVAWGIAVHAQ